MARIVTVNFWIDVVAFLVISIALTALGVVALALKGNTAVGVLGAVALFACAFFCLVEAGGYYRLLKWQQEEEETP